MLPYKEKSCSTVCLFIALAVWGLLEFDAPFSLCAPVSETVDGTITIIISL